MDIIFSHDDWVSLKDHLRRGPNAPEHAAFAFGYFKPDAGFEVVEVRLLNGDELAIQTPVHIEVADDVRAEIIKYAHDLQASLIEIHSHVQDPGPSFSWSDWHGFGEFVPHIWFRLKGKPYAAIVVGPDGLDALAWISDAKTPVAVQTVGSVQESEACSGLSLPRTGGWR